MKKLLTFIICFFAYFVCEAQTNPYPITSNLGGPTTLVQNPNYGAFKGGLIPYTFTDTSQCNSLAPYLKNYDGTIIKTTTPIISLWTRDLTNTVWLQLSVSGSPTVNAWLTRGNDLSGQSLPNRLGTKNGDLLNIITSDQIRAIIPAGGIVRSSSAQNKYLMQDTIGKEIYYGDGGGTTPTWQQTLTAGSTLNVDNTAHIGINKFDLSSETEGSGIVIDPDNNITKIGDVNTVNTGVVFTIYDNNPGIAYFDVTAHNGRFGINTTSPDSALKVVGGIYGTRGLRLSSLTNLSTQNRLLGQFGTDGNVGYITLGSGLSLSSGVLNTSGTVATPISSLTAATASNSIDNTVYPQLWNWTGLTQNGLLLAASTTAAISGQTLFSVGLSGANAAAGRTTYAASFQNTHTGTSSTNYALFLNAAGASSANYALVTNNGDVLLNQSSGTTTFGNAGAVSGIFNVAGSGTGLIKFQPQSAAGTYNWNWPTTAGTSGQPLLSGGGGATAMSFGTLSAGGGGTGNTATPTDTYIAVGDGTKYVPTDPSTISTLPYWKLTGTNTLTGDVTNQSANVGFGVSPNTQLHTTAFAAAYTKVTSNSYTILATDYTLSVDNSGSNWDITLPDASTCTGRIYIIKRYDDNSTGNITIGAVAGQVQDVTIGSFGSTYDLPTWGSYKQSIMYQSNGTDWECIK